MSFPRDLLAGAVILALCAALYYVTTTFDSDPLGMAQGMPATEMPRLILGLIAGLTILMIVQGWRAGQDRITALPPWPVWATAALLGTAAALFSTIGVPIAFFIVCTVLPVLWGARNVRLIAAFALAIPAAIYVIFQLLLNVRLPVGPLSALGL